MGKLKIMTLEEASNIEMLHDGKPVWYRPQLTAAIIADVTLAKGGSEFDGGTMDFQS